MPANPPAPAESKNSSRELFSRFARKTSAVAGHPAAFVIAVSAVIVWAALGPRMGYSSDWQLWINTSTTILTFLMVFVLQHSQNHDSRVVQIKLDELLRAVKGARNELIDLENLSEEDLARYCREFEALHLRYTKIVNKKGTKVEVTSGDDNPGVISGVSKSSAGEPVTNFSTKQ